MERKGLNARMAKREMNIYEIAKEAGVSVATVSRVINHQCTVKEENRRRVEAVIEKYNYVPSSAAQSLSSSTSSLIGVVIPDIDNPFFVQILQGVTEIADTYGFQIFLFNTDENSQREAQVLKTLRQHRLQGVIISPVLENSPDTMESLLDFEKRNVSVVLLDRLLEGADFDRVASEDETGSFQAVSRLIAEGHRRIAIITGPETSRPGFERKRGFLRAMQEHHLPVPEEYICQGDFRMDSACELTHRLCALPTPPTAIFSSNNMTTYGCIKAFNELGLTTGKDISLFGFDDIEPLNWLNYNVSVVNRDAREMGRQAMRLLCDRFGNRRGGRVRARVLLPTELILRGSERCRSISQRR